MFAQQLVLCVCHERLFHSARKFEGLICGWIEIRMNFVNLLPKQITNHNAESKNCNLEFVIWNFKITFMDNSNQITRAQFMAFFRDEDSLNTLTPDDRIEMFRTVLLGSSDFTKKLLDEILSDYGVEGLKVVEKSENLRQRCYNISTLYSKSIF